MTTVDAADWSAAMAINVLAPVAITLELLPRMLDNGWGRIVNVSSGIVGRHAALGFNAYAASKPALEAHTLNLAAELAGTGVSVNCFRPGSVDTAMNAWVRNQPPESIGAASRERFNQIYSQGLLKSPEYAARFLLEHLANDETGEIWAIPSA